MYHVDIIFKLVEDSTMTTKGSWRLYATWRSTTFLVLSVFAPPASVWLCLALSTISLASRCSVAIVFDYSPFLAWPSHCSSVSVASVLHWLSLSTLSLASQCSSISVVSLQFWLALITLRLASRCFSVSTAVSPSLQLVFEASQCCWQQTLSSV